MSREDAREFLESYVRAYPKLPPGLVRQVAAGMFAGVLQALARGEGHAAIRERAKGVMHDHAAEWHAKGVEFDRAELLTLGEVVMERALGTADGAGDAGG